MTLPTRCRWAISVTALLSALCGCGRGSDEASSHVATVWPMVPSATGIPAPRSLCVATNGELYALDTIGRVLVYGPEGQPRRQWSMPETSVGRPEGIVELQDGSILVADTHYHRLVRFSPQGEVLSMWGREGEGIGEFIYPVAVAQDPEGLIYVAEYGGNDRIQVFAAEGTPLRHFGSFGTGEGQFQRCSGLAFLTGRLYVADAINNRIQVYSPQGERLATFDRAGDRPFRFPYDIAVTSEGLLAVVEYSAGRVTWITPEGARVGSFGRAGSDVGCLATPWGIAAGAGGRVFVADTGNHRLVVLSR